MGLIVDVFSARSDNFGYLVHDEATGRTAAIDAPEAGPERLSHYYDDPIKVGIGLTMIWAVFGMFVGVPGAILCFKGPGSER